MATEVVSLQEWHQRLREANRDKKPDEVGTRLIRGSEKVKEIESK